MQKKPSTTFSADRGDGRYALERILVEAGDSSGDLVAIAGPLTEGARGVVRGAETLSDGTFVSILGVAGGSRAAHASGS